MPQRRIVSPVMPDLPSETDVHTTTSAAVSDGLPVVAQGASGDPSPAEAAPLAQDAYQELLEALTSLDIEPGDRITVDSLAREFRISQTPIREALTRLESERLVVKHHLRGYRAAPRLDARALEDLFAFRAIIEPAAAAWAASAANASDIEYLRSLEAQMAAQATHQGYGDFAVLDSKFHNAIGIASRNQIMVDNLERLHVHVHLFRVRRDQAVADAALDEHRLIVEAIERGDPILAEAAMRSHIRRSWARLSEVVET